MRPLPEVLSARPVVAVLRAPTAERFVEASEVLYETGIVCVEYTLTSEGALDALVTARKRLPRDIRLGIGTVRTVAHVDDAAEAGADFLVNQAFRPELVQAAHRNGVPFIPGALTPTEIVVAWDADVPAVKVSPIGPLGGLAYLGELLGPLPDIPVMPTGGVGIEEAGAYLRAGAAAIGVSRALVGDALHPAGDLAGLRARAERVVESLVA